MPVQTPRRPSSMDPAVVPVRATTSSSTSAKAKAAGGGKVKTARRRRKDPLWARLALVMGAVLMVSSGVAIAGGEALLSSATSSIQQDNLLGDAGKSDAEGGKNLEGPIDFLLLGVDVRGSWDHDATRADTIIILHIPATHDQAYLISIPRDTEVRMPAFPKSKFKGATDKINSAFFFGAQNGAGWGGGAQLMASTIKSVTGITFDGAAIIDFNGFKNVIDALGTIHMCVDQRVESHHMSYVDGKPMWNADAKETGKKRTPVVHKPGCREMEGWEALDYSRQRYGLKNGDYDRQKHQQQLIKAIVDKATQGGVLTNPVRINSLIKAAGKAFTLDLGGNTIADYMLTLRNVPSKEMIMLRTNNGTFSEDGSGREVLKPLSKQMFAAVKSDTVGDFIVANPSVVAKQ